MPIPAAQPPAPSGFVFRSEVLQRARFWVDQQVHYLSRDGRWPDQAPDPQGLPYRTDCSGFVCMAWRAETQPSTAEFGQLGDQVDADALLPGDALLWKGEGGYGDDGGHTLVFRSWADPDRTSYLAYELAGGGPARARTVPFPYLHHDPRYVPWRYRKILPD